MSGRSPLDHDLARRAGRSVNRALQSVGVEFRRAEPASPAAASPEPEPEPVPGSGPGEPPAPDPLSTDLLRTDEENRATYAVGARRIVERHRAQRRSDVELLRRRYAKPLFGRVRVWDLIERLGACVDPSDERLYCASQLMHVRQILEEMEADGTATPPMVLVALLHDLGKLLLLTGEDPANVVCMNSPIGENPEGGGLDRALVQWNHDELAFQRLDGLIPDDLAWLIRYHSLEVDDALHLMDASDLDRMDRLLRPFAHYDHATKSPYHLPVTPWQHYRDVIEEAFPDPILF
jgi:hypothetical protein